MVKEEFTLLEEGKIKWEYTKDDTTFEDKEFGRVGTKGGYEFIIFDSYEQAMSVLDRDITQLEQNKEHFEQEMNKNTHKLDTFTDIKHLLDKVAELNLEFTKVTDDKVQALYRDNPKKYQKLLSSFNSSKELFGNELQHLSQEYDKMQKYEKAKEGFDFYEKELQKTLTQKEKLKQLFN